MNFRQLLILCFSIIILISCTPYQLEAYDAKKIEKKDQISYVELFYNSTLWISPPEPSYISDDPSSERCLLNKEDIIASLFDFQSSLKKFDKSDQNPIVDTAVIIWRDKKKSIVYFNYVTNDADVDFVVDNIRYKTNSKLGQDFIAMARVKCGKDWPLY
jgi:hypothetical protein